ncbi:sensor histidine kinase [Larkinella insperata]|uniref:Sensor histidine kinase n=1 Tax=Larkinella insperata TaxID=332158 RepID=A0ABW3QEY9_9BACT|nr:histidine kinase [Larkinella insperata]
MSFDSLGLLYMGSLGALFALNAVQWGLSRDRVHGLFTLQLFIWLAYSISQRYDVGGMANYLIIQALVVGLSRIIYLELVYQLFDLPSHYPRLRRWLRIAQRVLVGYLLLEELAIITFGFNTHPAYPYISALYWLLVIMLVATGIGVASHRRDAVGRFFLAASAILLLRSIRTLVFYTAFQWSWATDPVKDFFTNVVSVALMVELLCLSLCLAFRQRQIAVAQAIEQTREKEQLIHERDQRHRESLEAELAVRRLEQEKTDVQLRALQAQVNPHFLFNSLNSLSSLIDENPPQASEFVDELSLVYRYLLKANDQALTALSSELDFIRSYFRLLKTRYGSGLDLEVRVDPTYESQLLPPLTLQLLVENAVKHNVVQAKRPLKVEILTDDRGRLIVRNNLQRKNTPVLSNGVGLSAILTQYQRLQQPKPVVENENGEFAVTLPLIVPAATTVSQ